MTWESDYTQKLQTADAAMRFIKSGMRVYIQPGCAESL
jgi:DeoR/GlpR family transcriptional regulator of sugar metabolism